MFCTIQDIYSHSSDSCNQDWLSLEKYTCTQYEEDDYCTAEGGYGAGWKDEWNEFSDWAVEGQDATVCPECGCEGEMII